MFYKNYSRQLSANGWICTEEKHDLDFYPHYFKYEHPRDGEGRAIEIFCISNKDGTPGKITEILQGGKIIRAH